MSGPTAYAAALRTLGPGALTVVDVGARWGADAAWYRLKPLARLFGFEPDPVECARLNADADPNSEQFVPLALGRAIGQATLHCTVEPACSSLYPPATAILERYPSLRGIMAPAGRATVSVTTLADWARSADIGRLDFLKLDTQGAELAILQGAGALLDGCLGVEAEVMFSPLYEGQPLFADVDAFLRSCGFTLWRLDSLAHYTDNPSDQLAHAATIHYEQATVRHAAGDGRLIWANAIYFRDREQIRHSARDLLALAALLEAAGDADGSRCCLVHAASAPAHEPAPATATPAALDEFALRRIHMTAGCTDCRALPKVPGAGQTFADASGRYQLMHNGVKVVENGYCGPWMTELIRRLRGHHEPQEERAFHELLRHLTPGASMLELGSYWAYYSLWFSRAVPDGRTFLVEPDPNHLDIGRRNYDLNRARGEFYAYSVGRRSAPAQPFVCESDGRTRAVPEVSVDDLFDRLSLPRVDVLLADIQGAELAMLEGAGRTLAAGQVRFAVVSTHHHRISGDPLLHQKCLAFVRSRGGHVLAEHRVAESFSGDGLIVASFDPADRHLPTIELSRNHPSNALFPETEYDLAEAWAALAAPRRAAG